MRRLVLPLLFAAASPLWADDTDPNLPMTARGNEPGWVMVLAADGAKLSTEAGETAEWPMPAGTADGGDTIYALADGARVRITPAVCRDSMTGMPHPFTVVLDRDGTALNGCGGDPASLLAGDWSLVELAGTGLPAEVQVTLTAADGDVAGNSGCNRYTGAYALTGEGLTLGPLAGTRMACPAPQSTVEAAYLAALDRVTRFDLGDDGALLLLAGDDLVARFSR
jgi:heat shock protein HslJ